ncbi:MAG: hypothetical protein ABSD50_04885 [Smithella sp.]|jgi:hypothetical protein
MDCEKNKLEFRDYVLGNWTFARVCLVIVFACSFGIPGYYSITAKIPPADELQKTAGIIFFQSGTKACSIRTGLKTPEGEILFTCRSAMEGCDTCIWDAKTRQQIQGKQGTVLWYDQPILPFVETNKLIVELWVNEKEIVGRGTIQSNIDGSFMFGCVWLPGGIVLFICADFNNIRRRRKKKCQDRTI